MNFTMNPADDPVEIETTQPVVASIVWMHGLGADGHDFVPLVPEFRLARGVRFVFPHAPLRPVTLNAGYVMRAWFDIIAIHEQAPQDADGIANSEQSVRALIETEHRRGIPYDQIFVAGFSQGGAMALHTALRFPRRLGGIIALSTFLPLHTRVEAEAHPVNRDVPIFMAHGTQDTVVPLTLGELSHAHLRTLGYTVMWRRYVMPHSVAPEEVADLCAWLNPRLAPAS